MPSPTLTEQQRQQISQEVSNRVQQAEAWLNRSLPRVDIRFNVRGAAWAYYQRHSDQRSIRFNPYLSANHFNETLNDVVPHEVAHFVVDSIYPNRRRPHGPEWKKVMLQFGIHSPQIRHDKDISQIPVRRQRRHLYRCACQEYQLTTTRHNRILRGQQHYSCPKCGKALKAA